MPHTCTIEWQDNLGQSHLHAEGKADTHNFELRFEFSNFGRIIEDGNYQIRSIFFIEGQDSRAFSRHLVVLIVPIHPINWIKSEFNDYVSFQCGDYYNHVVFRREKSSFLPSIGFDDDYYRYLCLELEKIDG